MKSSRFKNFVSVFIVLLLLVPSFVLVVDKKVFAATTPVTWNPNDKVGTVTLSNGDLTTTTTSAYSGIRATKGVSSGKWYWEVTLNTGIDHIIGVANLSFNLAETNGNSPNNNARCIYPLFGKKSYPLTNYTTPSYAGDIIGIALDMDNGTITFYKNGVSLGIAFSDLKILGIAYPYMECGANPTTSTANFGATPFAYPIPTGYSAYDQEQPSPSNNPTNLSATSASGQVSLTWSAVTGATSYNVKRADTAGGPYTTNLANVTTPNYTDTSVTNGTKYYYVVTAITVDGESPNSNEASATPTASTEDNDRLYVLLDIAEQAQLSVTSNLSDNASLTWTSSDPSVATVDANGKVTAVAEGTSKITAAKSDGTFTDYIPIKVSKNAEQLRLALYLNAGESKQLWISDDNTGVTWTSMDPSIAKVDSTGKVTGVAKGLCIIQAELSGKTYYIYARVNA